MRQALLAGRAGLPRIEQRKQVGTIESCFLTQYEQTRLRCIRLTVTNDVLRAIPAETGEIWLGQDAPQFCSTARDFYP